MMMLASCAGWRRYSSPDSSPHAGRVTTQWRTPFRQVHPHFGFLANRNRAQALALCRRHLHSGAHDFSLSELLTPEQRQAVEHRCPRCRQGTLHLVARLSVEELMIYMHPITAADSIDSS